MLNNSFKFKAERSFGIVFFIFFSLISFYPLINREFINVYFFSIGVIFLLVGFLAPILFVLPNKLWIMFGNALGNITSPIIITIIYFLVVVPTSLILRLFKKDILDENIDKEKKTYWIERKNKYTNFKRQF
jgi:hypothetical protein|tara:strand:- start:4025 stop:4417 length:393 start_codon:yes stop_codon:yes gene_type:complete